MKGKRRRGTLEMRGKGMLEEMGGKGMLEEMGGKGMSEEMGGERGKGEEGNGNTVAGGKGGSVGGTRVGDDAIGVMGYDPEVLGRGRGGAGCQEHSLESATRELRMTLQTLCTNTNNTNTTTNNNTNNKPHMNRNRTILAHL